MKKKIRKEIGIAIIFTALIVVLTGFAGAEYWLCFNKGDTINYCNPITPDRSCRANNGCLYCMDSYDNSRGCYNQGNFNLCNESPPICSVGNNGGAGIDAQPPVLDVKNPIEDSVYNDGSVFIDISMDERADLYYKDNREAREKWNSLCKNCDSYRRSRNFRDGVNDLTFKAVDSVGNTRYTNISFLVDTKKPRISGVSPTRGFSSGLFKVWLDEANPSELTLYYGHPEDELSEFFSFNADLSLCAFERGKYKCNVSVELSEHNGHELLYFFKLKDIVGNFAESRKNRIIIDNVKPIINMFEYNVSGARVDLVMGIEETNFDSIEYMDNSISRPSWRTICSRLDDRMCKKRLTFRRGAHNVDFRVNDKAGNFVMKNVEFNI